MTVSDPGAVRVGLWAAAATGVQVGAAIVASRVALEVTTPIALAFMRYLIGVACLAPVAWMMRPVRFAARDVLPIALLGIGQFAILVALLNAALLYLPSAPAALLFSTFPFLTLLLGATLGLERLDVMKTLAVALTIVGVGCTLGAEALDLSGRDAGEGWKGALLALASAGVGAACAVFYRPYLERYPTVHVSTFAMLASVLFLAPLAAMEGFFSSLPALGVRGWSATVFIGVSSGIGYFVWLYALGRLAPTRATTFLCLSPITAALVGIALLGETLRPGTVAGIVLVSLGLWVMARGVAEPSRTGS